MAGIGEDGELIHYPGENDSKTHRFLYGSNLHGGGFLDFIVPVMIIGGIVLLSWAVLTDAEHGAEITTHPVISVEESR